MAGVDRAQGWRKVGARFGASGKTGVLTASFRVPNMFPDVLGACNDEHCDLFRVPRLSPDARVREFLCPWTLARCFVESVAGADRAQGWRKVGARFGASSKQDHTVAT